MKEHSSKVVIWVLGILLLAALGYGTYRYITLRKALAQTKAEYIATRTALQQQLDTTNEDLATTIHDKEQLTEALQAQEQKIAEYQRETIKLHGAVDTFEKLSKLDPELLKKYSKVYFLNEHYIPSALADIPAQYISGKNRKLQLHAEVWPHMKEMLDDANDEELGLLITSAYRSFGTQASLKAAYKVTYGTSAANRFSADQGYSEHQLGTTVDFTTIKTGDLSSSFDKTPEFKWLSENAYRYGFVLSYPKNNKYYIYEPWHWRYVGIDLATKLHTDNDYLYDTDQRDIDGYLISIFD